VSSEIVEQDTAMGHIVDVKAADPDMEDQIVTTIRNRGEITTRDVQHLAAINAMKKIPHNKFTYRLSANRKVNGGKKLVFQPSELAPSK
jgi:hypothetical protein